MQNIEPEDNNPCYQVAVGVIEQNDNILIAKRTAQQSHAGLWEFPGGKIHPSETPYQALVRELKEELGIRVQTARPMISICHEYEGYEVHLQVFHVSEWIGNAEGIEGQEIQWVAKTNLPEYTFMTANKSILRAILLPEIYSITPDLANMSDDLILAKIENQINQGISLFQFRDKNKDIKASRKIIHEIYQLCQSRMARLLLNGPPALLEEIPADGIHLSSKNLVRFNQRPVDQNTLLSVACHNLDEIRAAEKIDADMILLGPVLQTNSHPDVDGMGWEQFREFSNSCNIPVYSLGGMKQHDLQTSWSHGAQGIAMISGLWQ